MRSCTRPSNSIEKDYLIHEIRLLAQNTRYPVYNVNNGIVPSSIVPFLEQVARLRAATDAKREMENQK